MDEKTLLNWIYADIDELIDFDGYSLVQEESDEERGKSFETGSNNGGSICDNSG